MQGILSSAKSHLRWLDRYLNKVALGAIDRELLDRIAGQKKAEGVTNQPRAAE